MDLALPWGPVDDARWAAPRAWSEMDWARPLLALATANNAVWAVLVAAVPERVFAVVPPSPIGLAVLIVAVGACFGINVFRRVPALLALGLCAKLLGPFVFVVAVARGYLRASSWPLVLLTDLLWIPPLAVLVRRRGSW